MNKWFLLALLSLLCTSAVPAQTAGQIRILEQQIRPLYRNPTKEEVAAIAPRPQLFQKYALFLSRPDTGLVRLAPDSGCAENKNVVVVSDECLKYTMPGAGFSYSFRKENYCLPSLADLIFTAESFQASGVLLHGILVNIGDVPLDEVTLKTDGLRFLVEFQPVTLYDDAKLTDQMLVDGVVRDGFTYRRGLKAEADTTFAMRSIAYNGTHYRAIEGVTYNELAFDKRQDIIVVFRIVDQGEDESVTILWKALARKNAPRMSGGRKVKRL